MTSDNRKRRPILHGGEKYRQSVKKSGSGGPKNYKRAYSEARDLVTEHLVRLQHKIDQIPEHEKITDEVVFSLIVDKEFLAKSYYPFSLFGEKKSPLSLQEVGSRPITYNDHYSKLYFVRAGNHGIEKLIRKLDQPESRLSRQFKDDIRKVSGIDIMPAEYKLESISEDWESGTIEAIFHPFNCDAYEVERQIIGRLKSLGVDIDGLKLRQYENGISFASFRGDKKMLNSFSAYNPLRVIHPIDLRSIPEITRGTPFKEGVKLPISRAKPLSVIGVIDGGLDEQNPFVAPFSDGEFMVKGKSVPDYVQHGTQVAGVVLYGPLNDYTSSDHLPAPKIGVKSFGVLSDQTRDNELYEAIDAIEEIVPKYPDIKVYNISLGPKGPISEDHINRFTYACDRLSEKYDVLFCVAVGNDGDQADYDRVQSPSDSVNSLAIGAYTKKDGEIVPASYSCVGPGREGCKMKPDIVAFGGSSNSPIHLISNSLNERVLNAGTSFASPIAARFAGQLIQQSNNLFNSLTIKAMMIQSAIAEEKDHCFEMGHGRLPDDIDEVLTCSGNSYTLIYQGEIPAKSYVQFEIPWEHIDKGMVEVSYTIAVSTPVDPFDSTDYTSSSIEVVFYPNSGKYRFSHPEGIKYKGKRTYTVDIDENPEFAKELEEIGFTRSKSPASKNPSALLNESELRADLKWDTIDVRHKRLRPSSLKNPCFHVHSMNRGSRNSVTKTRYAIILKVSVKGSDEVDIYSSVLNRYEALLPIQTLIDAEASIDVDTPLNPD